MRLRDIEIIIVCVFLLLTIAEFIQVAVQFRLFGPNLLHYRIWQYLVVIVILLNNPKAFTTKSMRIMYLYMAIYFLLAAVGHYVSERYEIVGTSTLSVLPISLGVVILMKEHYFRPEKLQDLRLVIRFAWLAYILACITSLVVIFLYPASVRGTEAGFFREEARSYRGFGLGGYGFFSSLPFLIPILFYQFKHSLQENWRKSVYLAALIGLFLFTVYKGVIVAPFLLAVFALIFSQLGRRRFKANIIVFIILVIVYVLLPNQIIGGAFLSVADVVPNRDMSNKFRDIGTSYISGLDIVEAEEGSTNTVEHRASRIMINIEQFWKNPLIGAGTAGNPHLYWLNLLAQFGLIGAFPLFWLIWVQFGYLRRFSDDFKFYYILSFVSYVALLFIKASGGYHFYLAIFFIVPGSYYLNNSFYPNSPVETDGYTHESPKSARNIA